MNKTTGLLPAILLLSIGCNDPGERPPMHELSGQTMGTTFSIKISAPGNAYDFDLLGQQAREILDRVDRRMSTWKIDSELSRFNGNTSTDWIEVSAEFCNVLESALAISADTGGAFDITVGPLVNLWGFGPGNSIRFEPPDAEAIEATRQKVGYRMLQTECDTPAVRKTRADLYIDLSGYAKGYAVDQLANMLDAQDVANYLVEIGGELRLRGRKTGNEKWTVAIEKPEDTDRVVQAIVSLTDQAMATSGDYRNFFLAGGRRYSHTIDPRSGSPVAHDAAAVTVLAKSAAIADALATGLLVLGPEAGLDFAEREQIAASFLLRHGEVIEQRTTPDFDALIQ